MANHKMIKLQDWLDRNFEQDSRPGLTTARRWCNNGTLPAVKQGACWYVEVTAHLDPLVDSVLRP